MAFKGWVAEAFGPWESRYRRQMREAFGPSAIPPEMDAFGDLRHTSKRLSPRELLEADRDYHGFDPRRGIQRRLRRSASRTAAIRQTHRVVEFQAWAAKNAENYCDACSVPPNSAGREPLTFRTGVEFLLRSAGDDPGVFRRARNTDTTYTLTLNIP